LNYETLCNSITTNRDYDRSKIQISIINYIEHPPIFIDDNSDFITLGFSGNGTKTNPFLIEGLNISNPTETAINIQGTTAFFIIRNNCLDGLSTSSMGILFQSVWHGLVVNNTVKNYFDHSIKIAQSSQNNISSNRILDEIDTYFHYSEIYLTGSSNNTISNNFIQNNHFANAIYLADSSHSNLISSNIISNIDGHSIQISNSNINILYNNSFYFNGTGILLSNSDKSIIYGNTFNSDNGLRIDSSSSDNKIKINNFIEDNSASDDGSNNVFSYNYWDNHVGSDENDDGIIDNPYLIGGTASNQDFYPMTSNILDILIPPLITYPREGDVISENILIEWEPALDFLNHEVTYSIYFSNNSGQSWNILSLYQTSETFQWDTTSQENGLAYLIQVVANCSEGAIVEDISKGSFSIQNHFLSLLIVHNPGNGDVIQGTVVIRFSMVIDSLGHQISYSLYYSNNSGLNWVSLQIGLHDTSFSWNTRSIEDETSYKIMVQATCTDGLIVTGFSDGTFSIMNTPKSSLISVLIQLVQLFFIAIIISLIIVFVIHIRKGMITQIRFSKMKVGVCLGSFTDSGFIVKWKSTHSLFDTQKLRHMVEYTAIMYQKGDDEISYGPFPQSLMISNKKTEWLFISYGFHLKDESVKDPRIISSGGLVPVVLLLFYPAPFDSKFQRQKRDFLEYLKSKTLTINTISELISSQMNGIENYVEEIFYS
jgi:parallel beta-helix repeat protein